MNDDRADNSIEAAGSAVASDYKADVYFYSGEINIDGFGQIAETPTLHSTSAKTALLILVTNGGSANSAYQIATLFQNTYERFILYTPSYCKSAGTIIALGASSIIMDTFSELGPLDVQLAMRNELGSRKSGLLTRAALEGLKEESFNLFEHFLLNIMRRSGGSVSFKMAAELSASVTTGLMASVYSQINPDILGSDLRDLEIALQYGTRLVRRSGNADADIVKHLVTHYPSHDFIINADEASSLFNSVEIPLKSLYQLVGLLGNDAFAEADETVVMALHPEAAPSEKETEDGSDKTSESENGSIDKSGLDDSGGADSEGHSKPSDEEDGN